MRFPWCNDIKREREYCSDNLSIRLEDTELFKISTNIYTKYID